MCYIYARVCVCVNQDIGLIRVSPVISMQVITDYLVGRDGGGDPTKAKDTTLLAMQEAGGKPSKHSLPDVLSNLLFDSDRDNSSNAVRSLRAMAAVVVSLASFNPPSPPRKFLVCSG